MPEIHVKRVKVLRRERMMPKWKEFKLLVHPDDTVCMLHRDECHLPHRLVVCLYKLKLYRDCETYARNGKLCADCGETMCVKRLQK